MSEKLENDKKKILQDYFENHEFPRNYDSWPTMWKSCYQDGVYDSLISRTDSEEVDRLKKECKNCDYYDELLSNDPDKECDDCKSMSHYKQRPPTYSAIQAKLSEAVELLNEWVNDYFNSEDSRGPWSETQEFLSKHKEKP